MKQVCIRICFEKYSCHLQEWKNQVWVQFRWIQLVKTHLEFGSTRRTRAVFLWLQEVSQFFRREHLCNVFWGTPTKRMSPNPWWNTLLSRVEMSSYIQLIQVTCVNVQKTPQNRKELAGFSNRKDIYFYGGCWAHYGKENSGKHNNRFPTPRALWSFNEFMWRYQQNWCVTKFNLTYSKGNLLLQMVTSRINVGLQIPASLHVLEKKKYFHGQQNLPSNVAMTINGREA